MTKTITANRAPAARGTGRRLTRALMALATLAGLAVVPVALVQLGLPKVSEVRSAVSLRWVPPELGGHLVAVVGWAAWVYVMAWLIVAVVAEARGASRNLPRLLRPALVPVVSVVMSLFVRSPAAAQHAMAPAAAVTSAEVSPSPTSSRPMPVPDRPTEWVVEEGQSLWSIAETVYGDGDQCPRIAAANPGLDPRDLQVGQLLRLPPGDNATYRAPQQWRVQKGESLWSIAEAVYGEGAQWERIAAANRSREVAPGQVLSEPSLIEPGWVLEIPPPVVPGPSGDTGAAPAPPAPSEPLPASAGPPAGASAPQGAPSAEEPSLVRPEHPSGGVQHKSPASHNGTVPSDPPQPRHGAGSTTGSPHSQNGTGAIVEVAVSLGLAAVAAGMAATLRLRRRVQQRRRQPGRRITVPPQPLADLEATLSAAKPSAPDLVDGGLRLLTSRLRDTGLRIPPILGVRRADSRLDLLLVEPASEAPAPFVAVGDGSHWRLEADEVSQSSFESVDEIAPCPTLVTAGADAEGSLLLHLEQARFLGCGGDATKAVEGLSSIAVELATSAWQGGFELMVVDFPAGLEHLESVRHTSLEEALAEAEERGRANTNHLLGLSQSSPSAAALAGNCDPPLPLVVLCGRQLVEHEAIRVADVTASPQAGNAVVVLGHPASARWLLAYEAEQVSVSPLGLTVRSSRLESDELQGLEGLLSATFEEDCTADSKPYQDHAPAGADGQRPEVEVRLLGPVEVADAAQPITRTLGVELVAFLATHARGVTTDIWTTALRPERRLSQQYVGHITSAARKGLGRRRRVRPTSAIGAQPRITPLKQEDGRE